MSQKIQGFYYPRTASGKASLIPPPPWYYSGNQLVIEYRTDPEKIAELLPEPLSLADDDPGAVALMFADFQACGSTREELLDPVRAQYVESGLNIRCKFEGRTYNRAAFTWVNNDASFLRGVFQGFSKKVGSVHMTRTHTVTNAGPALEVGARLGATVAASDRRIAQAVVTLTERVESAGTVATNPFVHHRHMPSIDLNGDAHSELVEISLASSKGAIFKANVDNFEVFESPTEELASLPIREVIGAFYQEIGYTFTGGKSLWRG